MSDTLSSLIAFVGFLIVFSMLIQSIQEGFKNALKLKSGAWERFFHGIYDKEFNLGNPWDAKLKSVAERISTSESVGDFNERLKRLRTIVADTDQAIKKTKELLLMVIKPEPDSPATTNIEGISQTLNEITQTLDRITGLKLDTLLEIYDKFSTNGTIKNFYDKLRDIGDRLNLLATPDLSNINVDCREMYDLIILNEKKISDYRLQIESRMDSWLSQIDEEYRRNMLKWTVIIGTAFVFLFNADSFSIYKYLSQDSKIRDAVIKNVADSSTRIQHGNPEILNAINANLREDKPGDAKNNILDFSKTLKDDYAAYGAKDKAVEIERIIDDTDKIPVTPDADKQKTKKLLEDKANKLTVLYVQLQKASFDYQLGNLSSLDLPLGWTADWKEFEKSYNNATCGTAYSFYALCLKKLGGLLMTSLLITFGAPFWNDILSALVGIKNMTLKKA